MSREGFNVEQIVEKLRQIEVLTAGGKALAQACKEAGITEVRRIARTRTVADAALD